MLRKLFRTIQYSLKSLYASGPRRDHQKNNTSGFVPESRQNANGMKTAYLYTHETDLLPGFFLHNSDNHCL